MKLKTVVQLTILLQLVDYRNDILLGYEQIKKIILLIYLLLLRKNGKK